nr:toxin secretion phage lysis holin [uncultured bacterium]
MKEIWTGIQAGFTAMGGFLGWFLGGMDGFIHALIAFVAVDYITGVLRAIVEKKLSSRIGAHGIIKKVVIFLIAGVANLADVYLLNEGGALRMAVIFFYISNEGISLLENAVVIGLPAPEQLKDALAQLHKRKSKDKDGEDE